MTGNSEKLKLAKLVSDIMSLSAEINLNIDVEALDEESELMMYGFSLGVNRTKEEFLRSLNKLHQEVLDSDFRGVEK